MPGAMEAHDTTEGIKGDCGGGKTFQEITFTNLSKVRVRENLKMRERNHI